MLMRFFFFWSMPLFLHIVISYMIYACVLVWLGWVVKGVDMNGWEVGMQDDVLLLLCGLFWRRGMGH
jgi:hypothetical protein